MFKLNNGFSHCGEVLHFNYCGASFLHSKMLVGNGSLSKTKQAVEMTEGQPKISCDGMSNAVPLLMMCHPSFFLKL